MRLSAISWHSKNLIKRAGLFQTTRLAVSVSRQLLQLQLLRKSIRQPIVVISLLERLGDIIASEPIVSQVRALHPTAFIIWCAGPNYKEILKQHPDINGLLIVRSLTQWRALASLFSFDRIYDLHPDRFPCHIFFPGFKKKYGDPSVKMENYYSFPGGLLGCFSRAGGLPLKEKSPQLYIPDSIKRSVDKLALPHRFAIAHTRSEETARDWRKDHWLRLHQELDIPLIEVGKYRTLNTRSESPIMGKLSILQTAEIIRRACFFIGVDSGPAHLAHAVRTPGVILLGSFKNFRRYNPYVGFYEKPPGAIHVRVNGPASEIPYTMVREAVLLRMATLEDVNP